MAPSPGRAFFDKVQLRSTCISSSSHMQKAEIDGGDKVCAAAAAQCVCVIVRACNRERERG